MQSLLRPFFMTVSRLAVAAALVMLIVGQWKAPVVLLTGFGHDVSFSFDSSVVAVRQSRHPQRTRFKIDTAVLPSDSELANQMTTAHVEPEDLEFRAFLVQRSGSLRMIVVRHWFVLAVCVMVMLVTRRVFQRAGDTPVEANVDA